MSIGRGVQGEVAARTTQTHQNLLANTLTVGDVGGKTGARDGGIALCGRLARGGQVEGGLSGRAVQLADEAHDDQVDIAVAAQIVQRRVGRVLRLAIVDGEELVGQGIEAALLLHRLAGEEVGVGG